MNLNPMREQFAIVGMSCLFPGASSLEAFWDNLIRGLNTTSPATAAQFGADPALYYDPQRRTHDTTYFPHGGFIQDAVTIPDGMDRAGGWSVHVAREALRMGGYLNRPDSLARCGLVLGNLSFPTQESHRWFTHVHDAALEQALGELLGVEDFALPRPAAPGADDDAFQSPAAVVARTFRLGGAHFCIDAACASSLYAVGLACAYLAAGKADLMLAGAVSAADPLFVNMGFTHFGAYPPEAGQSRPLDSGSEGLVSGEGAGLLLLKRYADALRDGDTIHAVVGGIGLSNDGKGKHPLTPNPRGQILAFQRAYAGGVDPRAVQYVECHASGTPLGDKTELSSMDEFFGAAGAVPRIGSVKSNHGHLLTVAGLASMLKVILSMAHGQIPATVGVQAPLTTPRFGPAQIVTQPTPWPDVAKVAGVNAFGFGGVSAHLVLLNREAAGQPAPISAGGTRPAPLAIVGMEAQFGGCDGLDAFAQTLYDGAQHFGPLPPKRWKAHTEDAPEGAYIDSFEIDFLRFKFPPKEDDQPTPQHLLLLKVADRAVQDAGLEDGSHVAVIVALDTELSLHQCLSRLDLSHQMREALARAGVALDEADQHDLEFIAKDAVSPPAQVNQYTSYIGNIVSSRVSALWNFSGPAFTTASAENTVYKALEIAQILLADETLDAVVIGAVDLAGGLENVALWSARHPANTGTPTLSFDQSVTGWLVGEGAGAVVLKRADKVGGGRVYATIEGVAIQPGVDAGAIAAAGRAALDAAGVTGAAIGYLEASASGIAHEDDAEIRGLNALYAGPVETPTLALGSAKANIGHTGAASGIAGLIKAALALHLRFIPATPNWTAPKLPEVWGANSRFYVPQESRTWFNLTDQPRYAAVSGLGRDGTCAHMILSDRGVLAEQRRGDAYLRRKGFYLFPVDGEGRDELLHRLRQLDVALDGDDPLPVVAFRAFDAFRSGRYVAAIVGRDRKALKREIKLALDGIPAAFERGDDWQTPGGSAFSANPLGQSGGVAFVYPGAFNSYPGLGQDWLHLFPAAHDQLSAITSDVGARVADPLLYPRSLAAPGRAEIRAARARLADNQSAMMESGASFAVLHTYVMRDIFKVAPNMAFGYSLGEGSMLWAMDVWRASDIASETLRHSPLFRSRLVGRKDAVREAWGLPAAAGDQFWASYVLAADPAVVQAELARETHVYLTHINTPDEVVIAGQPSTCERIIERLGCGAVRAPFETVIHSEVIISEYGEFHRMHDWPVHIGTQNVTFYSAADYEPMRLERELIARNIARVSCKQVDFPRLIHRVYRDGARVFIELGPGSTCARWISDTLKADGREHVVVSVDNLRLDDHSALIKMLARLVSHRVPLDLSPLYEPHSPAAESKRLPRMIRVGGEPIRDFILTEEHIQRFGAGRRPGYASPAAPVPAPALDPAPYGYESAMQGRLAGLRELGAALRAQVRDSAAGVAPVPTMVAAPAGPRIPPIRYTPRPAIFDRASIDQFARGSIKACFGPEYAIYDDRRAPRIPNTDLMLLTRIVAVDATRLVTRTGSSMTAEYDVPVDMWFYRDNPYPFTPYSMLMEMALQPCGFLSAFMGPTLDFPDIDFYFRNLDGQGYLTRDVDLRGRTLINRVELVSSTILQGIIIQKYTFDMVLDGESFYSGNSTFGYFTLQALSSQAGLDMGKPPTKWHEADGGRPLRSIPGNRAGDARADGYLALPQGQLAFLDEVRINTGGGRHEQGYIYATSRVHPSNWYFACHFHDDPVMPGSLGLETITQAIQAYALEAGLADGLHAPRFSHVPDHTMVWKYRGQVLGDSDSVDVEVHIRAVERVGGDVHIHADASLWKGALRIYEFKDVGVRITEGE